MNSFAVSRSNCEAANDKDILEIGLHAIRLGRGFEAEQTMQDAFLAAIFETPSNSAPRLILADWLAENGREKEAMQVRHIASNRIDGETVWDGWFRKSDGKRLEEGEVLSRDSHVYEKRRPFSTGRWSVVRRITEGANGGHRQHVVSWTRVTINVVRTTDRFAVLADGKRLALSTLTACVPLL